jgi:hypothetical protein
MDIATWLAKWDLMKVTFICVNTRQLKDFLGRCKSSINGSFQQLGYVAVPTKSKARTCVLSLLPGLVNEPNILRQWTVRGASGDSQLCFVSRFKPEPLPEITPADLADDRPAAAKPVIAVQPTYRPPSVATPPLVSQQWHVTFAATTKRKLYAFDIAPFPEDLRLPEMTPSFSLDLLSAGDLDWSLPVDFTASEFRTPKAMTRSRSESFGLNELEWPFGFGDGPMFDL